MNINELIIIEYFKHNKKLILKKLGVLKIKIDSAYFDKNKVLHPPKKYIYFSEENISYSDHDFISFLAGFKNIPLYKSIELYTEWIKNIENNINKNKEFIIENFGIIYKKENEILFKAISDFSFLNQNQIKTINLK